MKRQYTIVALTTLVCIALVALTYLALSRHPTKLQQAEVIKTTAISLPDTKPNLDPLTIEAIRARSYTPSQVNVEQELGGQGGYSNAIVSYQSDGLKVQALRSTPDGQAPPDGWPVIILNHGYSDPTQYQTNNSEYQDFIASFARAGYVVFKPDYRGHGQSQGQPEGGHFSPVYVYDDLNLVATLKQTPGINPGRIGMFGHSLGGHVTLRSIVSSPDIKASVIAAGVVGSFNDIFFNWPNSPMPGDRPALIHEIRGGLIAKYGDPKSNPEFWNSVSALNFVSNIVGPVQVDHSELDGVVPKLFSDHLVEALKAAGKPYEYFSYPGNDHLFNNSRGLIVQRATDFFRAHL